MTTQRELERALDAFFAQGADEVADRVIDDALLTIDHTPQRRVLSVPWRPDIMNPFARLAVAAAAIVIVAGGAFYLLSPGNQGVGGPPAATPAPSAGTPASSSPAPAPTLGAIDPATWVTYTSERFGYALTHPAGVTITASQSDWQPGTIHSDVSRWADEISDAGGGLLAQGYTIFAGRQDLGVGQTPESWIAEYISNKSLDASGICGDISAEQYEPVAIDGEPGSRIAMRCSTNFYTAAIVVHDGSAYLVALATIAGSDDARAVELFDAVLTSFKFAAS